MGVHLEHVENVDVVDINRKGGNYPLILVFLCSGVVYY
jgi:hypothetical protein